MANHAETKQILEGELWTEQIAAEWFEAELAKDQTEMTEHLAALSTCKAENWHLKTELRSATQETAAVKQQLATAEAQTAARPIETVEISIQATSSGSTSNDPRLANELQAAADRLKQE